MDTADNSKKWMMSSFVFGQKPEKIDKEIGVLTGVYVVTEGEAKGHGVSLDADFVKEVEKQGNAKKQGLKARFGHPNMSSTALGTFIGRVKNFREGKTPDGKAATLGDLFLSNSAKEAPSGDLHKYVLSLASEDSKAFGMSIVFTPGKQFRKTDTGKKVYHKWERGEDGKRLCDEDGKYLFSWVDEQGNKVDPKENIIERDYVECEDLNASDLVDDPAANPDGIFSAFNESTIAGQVSEFLDLHPQVFELAKQRPEIIQNFFEKYEHYKQKIGAKTMEKGLSAVAEPAKADSVPAVEKNPVKSLEAASVPAVTEPAKTETVPEVKPEPAEEKTYTAKASEIEKMQKDFGSEIAMKAILSGGSYDKAKEFHYEALKIENETLKKQPAKRALDSSVKPAAAGVEPKEKPQLFNNIP